MTKNKYIVLAIIILLVVSLHFVPVQKFTGYQNCDAPKGEVSSCLCIGYGEPATYDFRLILGGKSGYDNIKATTIPSKLVRDGFIVTDANGQSGCGEPRVIKLYLL